MSERQEILPVVVGPDGLTDEDYADELLGFIAADLNIIPDSERYDLVRLRIMQSPLLGILRKFVASAPSGEGQPEGAEQEEREPGNVRFMCLGCEGWFSENEVTTPSGNYHCGNVLEFPLRSVSYVQALQDRIFALRSAPSGTEQEERERLARICEGAATQIEALCDGRDVAFTAAPGLRAVARLLRSAPSGTRQRDEVWRLAAEADDLAERLGRFGIHAYSRRIDEVLRLCAAALRAVPSESQQEPRP